MVDYPVLLKAVGGGFAAVGFAVLFNTGRNILYSIFLIGFTGILVRLVLNTGMGLNIVTASFLAASAILRPCSSKSLPWLSPSLPQYRWFPEFFFTG
jgi:uncharacterized membrane protein YjjP (DUF1212 family)